MPAKRPAYTVGSDIEWFVQDVNGVVPAPLLIPDIKKGHAEKLFIEGKLYGSYHWDNAALEFATVTHTTGSIDKPLLSFYPALRLVRSQLIKELGKDLSYPIAIMNNSTVVLSTKHLSLPPIKTFGCVPDYNIYSKKENHVSKNNPAAKRGLRTAGGHIHFGFKDPEIDGFDRDNYNHYEALAMAFDVFVGAYLIQKGLINFRRMQLYGRLGDVRIKPEYPGIEYRVPCNTWSNFDAAYNIYLYHIVGTWKAFLEPAKQEVARALQASIVPDNPSTHNAAIAGQLYNFAVTSILQ